MISRLFRVLWPLGINQDIARSQRFVTESAEHHASAVLFQKEHPVEYQPQFQRAAEKMTHQFHQSDLP